MDDLYEKKTIDLMLELGSRIKQFEHLTNLTKPIPFADYLNRLIVLGQRNELFKPKHMSGLPNNPNGYFYSDKPAKISFLNMEFYFYETFVQDSKIKFIRYYEKSNETDSILLTDTYFSPNAITIIEHDLEYKYMDKNFSLLKLNTENTNFYPSEIIDRLDRVNEEDLEENQIEEPYYEDEEINDVLDSDFEEFDEFEKKHHNAKVLKYLTENPEKTYTININQASQILIYPVQGMHIQLSHDITGNINLSLINLNKIDVAQTLSQKYGVILENVGIDLETKLQDIELKSLDALLRTENIPASTIINSLSQIFASQEVDVINYFKKPIRTPFKKAVELINMF